MGSIRHSAIGGKTTRRPESKAGLLDILQGIMGLALRRLKLNQTKCFRVRRISDGVEIDIGFRGNEIDSMGLINFIGASKGVVVKWYDPESGLDATQATADKEPQIVDSGSLELDANGKVQMTFDGIDDELQTADSDSFKSLSALVLSSVSKILNASTYGVLGYVDSYGDARYMQYSKKDVRNNFIYTASGATNATSGGLTEETKYQTTVYDRSLSSARLKTRVNGVAENQANGYDEDISAGGNYFTIGRAFGGYADMEISEVILFASALSDVQIRILESSQKKNYGL